MGGCARTTCGATRTDCVEDGIEVGNAGDGEAGAGGARGHECGADRAAMGAVAVGLTGGDGERGNIERALLPLWTLFIALVGTFPFTNFVGHSHWEYIQWLPTAANFSSRRFLFDIVANITLFLPLGYLIDRSHPTLHARRSLFLCAGVADLL